MNIRAQDSIFIKIPGGSYLDKSGYDLEEYPFSSDTAFSIYPNKEMLYNDKSYDLYRLFVSRQAKVRSINSFNTKSIYTLSMMMDSLNANAYNYKNEHNYMRKIRNNIYLLIKGFGSIWYLHRADILYIGAKVD